MVLKVRCLLQPKERQSNLVSKVFWQKCSSLPKSTEEQWRVNHSGAYHDKIVWSLVWGGEFGLQRICLRSHYGFLQLVRIPNVPGLNHTAAKIPSFDLWTRDPMIGLLAKATFTAKNFIGCHGRLYNNYRLINNNLLLSTVIPRW